MDLMNKSVKASEPMVEVNKLNVIFDKSHIIHDVSFNVNKGRLSDYLEYLGREKLR